MKLPTSAAFAVCVVVWGGSWFAIRAAVDGADPIGIAALRTSLAFVLLAGLALALRLPRPTRAGALRGMGVGVVFIGLNFAFVYWGATRVPAGLAALLYATTPLQAALLAPLFGLARTGARTILAALLGLAAIAVAFFDAAALGAFSALGVVAILLGATTSAAGSVMARKWSTLHPIWLNVFANLSASVALWTHYAFTGEGPFTPTSAEGWIGFAYMLLGASVVAFLAYFHLLRAWDAARATFTALTTPFVALAIGAIAFGEAWTPAQVLGAALLLGAGYLAIASPSAASANAISAARNRLSEK